MIRLLALAMSACVAAVAAVSAQPVTQDDLFTLQDALYDASREVNALQATDAALAAQLQRELDQIREETIYLRVRLRKEGTLPRADVEAVRARIDGVRARARGQVASAPPEASAPAPEPVPVPVRRPAGCGPEEVCVGQELDVRLQTSLDSDRAMVEDRFEATTVVPFYNEDRELIPAGSLLTGVVSGVTRAGRTDRKASMTLAFEQITVRGRSYPIRATVTQAIESRGLRGEVGKISVGAGVGAIIGGILGGVGGAVAGTVVGAGGMILATEGPDVRIPAGTILRVRFDAPVTIR